MLNFHGFPGYWSFRVCFIICLFPKKQRHSQFFFQCADRILQNSENIGVAKKAYRPPPFRHTDGYIHADSTPTSWHGQPSSRHDPNFVPLMPSPRTAPSGSGAGPRWLVCKFPASPSGSGIGPAAAAHGTTPTRTAGPPSRAELVPDHESLGPPTTSGLSSGSARITAFKFGGLGSGAAAAAAWRSARQPPQPGGPPSLHRSPGPARRTPGGFGRCGGPDGIAARRRGEAWDPGGRNGASGNGRRPARLGRLIRAGLRVATRTPRRTPSVAVRSGRRRRPTGSGRQGLKPAGPHEPDWLGMTRSRVHDSR